MPGSENPLVETDGAAVAAGATFAGSTSIAAVESRGQRGSRQLRRAILGVHLLLGAFLASLALAVASYPGGSWADASAGGFDLLANYWCDLMRTEAANGAANAVAAVASRWAFSALAAGLLLCWWLVAPAVASRRRARAILVASGTAASLAMAVMTLLPFDTEPRWHGLTTLVAGSCGLLASTLAVAGGWRAGIPAGWKRAWGAGLLLAAGVNLLVYARLALTGGGDSAALPVVQELATLLLVGWMVATVRALGCAASTHGNVCRSQPDARS